MTEYQTKIFESLSEKQIKALIALEKNPSYLSEDYEGLNGLWGKGLVWSRGFKRGMGSLYQLTPAGYALVEAINGK